ncbi:aldo/keto reductase [Aestuariicoccus sp. MJ-SS9]|uniref:aldo/keto reductase n=1 Tax=Aestuariicoccus sp. MJ-SS9 TaxID=3079855 RepID=UPI0029128689|nr:aldo/keto reductase [Aestuariicoccus sp. MJ-SS9]MDU8913513.1 aldo/keto reductase [Aestuariicoccus sp. MJ-SS9]
MRSICLPNTDLNLSRFVFGTASLHHLGRDRVQAAHLEAAAAAGFTHFDTAPLYGFGGAERVLGAAFSNTPGITITTKVGLYPPGGGCEGHTSMLVRKVGGKLWPPLSRAVADLTVDRARRSLEDSLRRLRRDCVDILLLHEPAPGLLATDEWQRWRDTEGDRIRHIGVAGSADMVAPFLETGMPLAQVIQVRDGLDTHEGDIVTCAGRPLQLTYGYFSSDKKGRCGAEILSGALARNDTGAILVYTRSRARLAEFVAAAAQTPQC